MKNWLPKGKKAAICFSIDDIHPGKSTDHVDAGGNMDEGQLGLVHWLLQRHPKLWVTLFTTADWREISPFPTRKILAKIPKLRDNFFLAKRWKKGKMALDNHPDFVAYLNNLERAEIALHGLHHVHKGLKIPVEFQNQNEEEFNQILKEMLSIFEKSTIKYSRGICPPGWNAPKELLKQLVANNINYVSSSRDVITPISKDALTNMSGLKGVSLLEPTILEDGNLVHIPVNFQATSTYERAIAIIENNGILSIKAHIIKEMDGYVALDGVDKLYMNYLDVLLSKLDKEYGDTLWWTSMGEIANTILSKKN